jgi:hypothetical protein
MPAIVSDAAVLLPTAQLAPASVTVTTLLVVEAEATVQLVNPVPSTTVGDAGTVKLLLIVTETESVAPRLPLEEVVKPTVHVELALAVVEPGVKETAETEVGVIVIPEAGFVGVASFDVATLNVFAL